MSALALPGRSSWVSWSLETIAAWVLAILWVSPLLYAIWAAFHAYEYATVSYTHLTLPTKA